MRVVRTLHLVKDFCHMTINYFVRMIGLSGFILAGQVHATMDVTMSLHVGMLEIQQPTTAREALSRAPPCSLIAISHMIQVALCNTRQPNG